MALKATPKPGKRPAVDSRTAVMMQLRKLSKPRKPKGTKPEVPPPKKAGGKKKAVAFAPALPKKKNAESKADNKPAMPRKTTDYTPNTPKALD